MVAVSGVATGNFDTYRQTDLVFWAPVDKLVDEPCGAHRFSEGATGS